MSVRLLLILLTFGLIWTAAPVAADEVQEQAASPTGLTGRVVLALRCPVPLGGDDSTCPQRPFPSTVTVRSADGLTELAQLATDEDGSFSIGLDPGSYILDVPSAAVAPARTRELSVLVGTDGPTAILVEVPSGVRRIP
jgi:hypothetical protein